MASALRESQAEADVRAGPRVGALVTLEGIDGSGKSTLAKWLHARLQEQGVRATLTREPTDTWLGEAVKRAIREVEDPFVDAFLFLADHADHVRRVRGWLQEGQVVVSDRYGDSCLAYQAASLEAPLRARGVRALDWLAVAQAPVTRAPDLCLLLDLSPAAALERLRDRAERAKYEEGGFLERVRSNYLELAKGSDRYEVLDATQPAERLAGKAWAALARRGLAPP